MITKDFTFCSVSSDTDFKIIGVELKLSDLPGQCIELTGHVTSIEAIDQDAKMQLHINGQTRLMVLTGSYGHVTHIDGQTRRAVLTGNGGHVTHFTAVIA